MRKKFSLYNYKLLFMNPFYIFDYFKPFTNNIFPLTLVFPLRSILRGISEQKGLRADRFMSQTITNNLFWSREKIEVDSGGKEAMEMSDLGARNIHRGRDHGLPDYNKYRVWAGLTDLKDLGIEPCWSCCA